MIPERTVMTQASIDVRVVQISYRAAGIHSFTLAPAAGTVLPPFSAGAHVEVRLPNGMNRPYSLHNRPGQTDRYEIAVKLEPAGRGGSRFLHEHVRVGDILPISPPINHFELVESGPRYVLIGAGIGVTPIIAMARRLKEIGADFVLHYCGRSREALAFLDDATDICGDRLHCHLDGGDPSRGLDVGRLVGEAASDTQIYCCGPTSLNTAVREAASGAHREHLHFENFAPPVAAATGAAAEIELAGTGKIIGLQPGQSVLDALRMGGYAMESSCEAGTCGACKTRLLAGEVDHQDFVLTDDEQRDWMMVCVSRPKGGRIKLDLDGR
jgi:ferredoxin-NADP reductase